ncbi:Hypothetical protein EHI5A_204400 [Entamoeba histolytica KU27]|uniref:Uncharacterized protein n=1 Tax=Entamoeba histolytica KU27 TaxID=885311 RepID=M2S3L2_ENTHI|nr:Hypothetical protein EHI5A_204400 [Entamoeba histolytica KU27]
MSIQSISASLENPRARRIASEHAFKNGFCFEQGVLLYLLNQYYDLVIKRQPKRSTLTLSCPHVESIQFEDEILDIDHFAEEQCKALSFQSDSQLKRKTLQRRMTKNKIYFIQNLLIDLLREKGLFFESKLAKITSKTIRLERINRVFYKNKLMLDCKQIHQLGNKINNYLLSLVETKKSFFIKQGDETLHQFWEEEIKEKCILE